MTAEANKLTLDVPVSWSYSDRSTPVFGHVHFPPHIAILLPTRQKVDADNLTQDSPTSKERQSTMPAKKETPNQIYMILSANKSERGEPIGFYTDPFKARADFAAINDMINAFTGNRTAFLVAYDVQPGGALAEVAELGCK